MRKRVEEYTKAKNESSLERYNKFLELGMYGPMFPCIFCHEFNWKYNSSVVKDIHQIQPGLLNHDYVLSKNIKLFIKLDCLWMCSSCKSSVVSNKRPKMLATDDLLCPWEDVPRELLKLNEVKHVYSAPILIAIF